MRIKYKDYAVLKVSAINKDCERFSGKSIEEIAMESRVAAQTAMNYLNELGLKYPTPASEDTVLIESRVADRVYRGTRRLPGKGVAQKAVVGLNVVTSVEVVDNLLWFHASIVRNDGHMPTYDDLCWLKAEFFGDRWAMQYFPTKDQHVSHHDKCLHLWTCLQNEFRMPDFRKFGSI